MATLIRAPAADGYDFGGSHPFSPVRVRMVLDLLAELGAAPEVELVQPATREEVLTVHSELYVAAVEAASADPAAADAAFELGTPDTPAFAGMELAARAQVGGTLHGAKRLVAGSVTRALHLGGGLHHAMPGAASGFCIYNDLAIAIRHLADAGHHVAYLDLDVHHGDGVQAVFERDERVLTISLHESGHFLFPGTGEVHELGEGLGRGLTVNLPLEPFTEGESYLECFEAVVPQVLEWFRPSALVVQAGADAHFGDPLADLALTTRDYEKLFARVLELAAAHAGGRLLVTFGGGYDPAAAARIWTILTLMVGGLPTEHALPPSWSARWAAHLGPQPPDRLHDPDPAFTPVPRRPEISHRNREVATRLLDALARYWF